MKKKTQETTENGSDVKILIRIEDGEFKMNMKLPLRWALFTLIASVATISGYSTLAELTSQFLQIVP